MSRTEVVTWVAAGGCLVALLLVARDGWIEYGAGVGVAALIAYVAVLGAELGGRYLVVLGLFLAPLSALVVPGASFVTAADAAFAVGFLLLIPAILRSRPRLPTAYVVGVFLILVTGSIASIAALHVAVSFNHMARFVAGVVLVPLAFLLWRPTVRHCAHLAIAYNFGVLVSAGYGVANGDSPGSRWIGWTEHPNVLGMTALLAVALVPFVMSQVDRRWHWAWLAIGAAQMGVVWFSGSRAALISLICLALMFPVIEKSARSAGWMLGAGAVLLLVIDQVAPRSGTALDRLLGGGSATFSDAQREELLRHYWSGFLDQPILGHGFEEAVLGHVVYLEVAFSIGVFGLAGFLLILLAGCLPMLTAPRPLHRVAYAPIAYAGIAMVTSVIWDRYIWSALALSFVIASRVGLDELDHRRDELDHRRDEPDHRRDEPDHHQDGPEDQPPPPVVPRPGGPLGIEGAPR